MLEYLILNNRLEAALKYNETSSKSYKDQLLSCFAKGKRVEFLRIFSLLKKQSKLEFYIRIYFLIYSIHPSLKGKTIFPEEEVHAFKDYLDARGSQLAKTSQVLEFYALPHVKRPLEHPNYKALFKKEWINNLTEKLHLYLNEQDKRLKQQVNLMTIPQSKSIQINQSTLQSKNVLQQSLKEVEQKNKRLFSEVQQFKEKYLALQQNHHSMIDSFNAYMMESQEKWFQITKELTNGSKSLIAMIIKNNSNIVNDRKFMKIKKRIEKYDKFVKKELDQLMSQSQDISIFDKPSVNQISYSASITPNITQRNLTTFVSIDEFIPTNYVALMKDFKHLNNDNKIKIIQGFSWRILKSKDRWIRRQTIIGLLVNDLFGVMNGDIMDFLLDKELMPHVLQLFSYISEDEYGYRVLFRNGGLYKELIQLIPDIVRQQKYDCLQKIIEILESLSPKKDMMHELIQLNIIDLYVELLEDKIILSNDDMLENILALLLNLVAVREGLDSFENQINIFFTLSQAYRCENNLIRSLIGGIIYTLLGRQTLFAMAHEAKLPQFIDYIIESDDKLMNSKQLALIQQRLIHFEPTHFIDINNESDDQSIDSNLQDQIFQRNQDQLLSYQEYIKGNDILNTKYLLKNKEANKQIDQINKIMTDQQRKKIKKEHTKQQTKDLVNPMVRKENKKETVQLPKIHPKKGKEFEEPSKQHPLKSKSNDNQDVYIYKSPSFRGYDNQNSNSKEQIKDFSHEEKIEVNNFQINNENIGKQRIKSSQNVSQKRVDVKVQRKITENNGSSKRKSTDKPQYRIKKSSSVQRNLGREFNNKEMPYQSQKNSSLLAEFKPIDDKNMKSPPQKRKRGDILKQLNEEIQAEIKHEDKKISLKNITPAVTTPPENIIRENIHLKKNNYVTNQEDVKAFASRPKIRRTPPKDDE